MSGVAAPMLHTSLPLTQECKGKGTIGQNTNYNRWEWRKELRVPAKQLDGEESEFIFTR
jgi:hypothetical protein